MAYSLTQVLSTFSFLTLLWVLRTIFLVFCSCGKKDFEWKCSNIFHRCLFSFVIVAALAWLWYYMQNSQKPPSFPPSKKKKAVFSVFVVLITCTHKVKCVVCSYLHLFTIMYRYGLSFIAFCGQSNTFTLLWVYYNKVDSFHIRQCHVMWHGLWQCLAKNVANTFASSYICFLPLFSVFTICDIWIITLYYIRSFKSRNMLSGGHGVP